MSHGNPFGVHPMTADDRARELAEEVANAMPARIEPYRGVEVGEGDEGDTDVSGLIYNNESLDAGELRSAVIYRADGSAYIATEAFFPDEGRVETADVVVAADGTIGKVIEGFA